MATRKATRATKGASAKPAPGTSVNSSKTVNIARPFRLDREYTFHHPPYVIENGGKYVSTSDLSGKKLTKELRQAWQFKGKSDADKFAKTLTDAWYPRTWSDPFTVVQLVATRKNLVTGTTTEDAWNAIDEPLWERCGRHDAALAESASWERESEDNGGFMHTHRYLLMTSPLWPLIVRLYDEERSAELVEDEVPELSKSDALAYFGARLFYAGVCAGRRENGKRQKFGDLVLDLPGMSEEGGEDLPLYGKNGGAR